MEEYETKRKKKLISYKFLEVLGNDQKRKRISCVAM